MTRISRRLYFMYEWKRDSAISREKKDNFLHICNPFYYYSKKTRIYFWSYSIFSPQKKFHRFKPNYFSKLIILMFKDLIKKREQMWRDEQEKVLYFLEILFFSSNIIMYLANLYNLDSNLYFRVLICVLGPSSNPPPRLLFSL